MEFRPSRSSSSRPAQRAASTSSSRRTSDADETPEVSSVTPQATYRPIPKKADQQKKKFSKRPVVVIVSMLVVAAVLGGWFLFSAIKNSATAINPSRYQAVFLINGQVYFGKLHAFTDKSMKLTDVYYLQGKEDKSANPENPQQTSASQKNVELIKLGDEIHGPEDEMVILLDQMTFYENLKPDSKIVESIERHKESKN